MNIKDRIFELLDSSGMKQQEFAERIGTTKDTVSKWRNTDLKSYKDYYGEIAEVLNTTTDYLILGRGPKYFNGGESRISNEELQLVEAYRRADDSRKETVRTALKPFGLSEPSDKAM